MTCMHLSTGPAVVALATLLLASAVAPGAATAAAARPAPAQAYADSDWKKLDPENLMVIDTSKGRVVVELNPMLAPEHVERIKMLTRQHYYDGLKFFRVIDSFMAQTGDKENTGAGESGLPMLKGDFEFRRSADMPIVTLPNPRGGAFGFLGPNPVSTQPDGLMALLADGKVKAWGLFCAGIGGMARTEQPDSASAQFFLMRQTLETLDDKYTPWGRVVAGQDVVRSLNVGEPPPNPDVMNKVNMASDLPAADRPNVWRVDTTSADFRAHAAAVAAMEGSQFTPCDIDVPSEIRK